VRATSGSLSEEVIGESVDSEQHLFLLHMHEGTLIKCHTAKFFSIINDLDKIEVKIEGEDQALYYCVFYLLHTRALGKLSYMNASQQSRS